MVVGRAPPPPTPGERAPGPTFQAPRDAMEPPAPPRRPEPSAQAAERDSPSSVGISSVLNTILVLSLLAPLIYRGPMNKAAEIYDIPSTLAGLVNSVAWLLFSVVVLKKQNCTELVVINVVCYISSFGHLLAAFKESKSTIKANILIMFTVLVFGGVFVLLQVDLEKDTILEHVFGSGSLVVTVVFLLVQLGTQLANGIRSVHVMGLLCSVLPNIAMSIWTLVYTLSYHRNRTIILWSSIINCAFQLLDLLLMTVAHRKSIVDYLLHMAQLIFKRIRADSTEAEQPENGQIIVLAIRRVRSAPSIIQTFMEEVQLDLAPDVPLNAPEAEGLALDVAAEPGIPTPVGVPAPAEAAGSDVIFPHVAAEPDLLPNAQDAEPDIAMDNQGLADRFIARLQSIRGIRRLQPRDEEIGNAQHSVAHPPDPVQRMLSLIRIDQAWSLICDTGLAYFVVSILLLMYHLWLMLCNTRPGRLVVRVVIRVNHVWLVVRDSRLVVFLVTCWCFFRQER